MTNPFREMDPVAEEALKIMNEYTRFMVPDQGPKSKKDTASQKAKEDVLKQVGKEQSKIEVNPEIDVQVNSPAANYENI